MQSEVCPYNFLPEVKSPVHDKFKAMEERIKEFARTK